MIRPGDSTPSHSEEKSEVVSVLGPFGATWDWRTHDKVLTLNGEECQFANSPGFISSSHAPPLEGRAKSWLQFDLAGVHDERGVSSGAPRRSLSFGSVDRDVGSAERWTLGSLGAGNPPDQHRSVSPLGRGSATGFILSRLSIQIPEKRGPSLYGRHRESNASKSRAADFNPVMDSNAETWASRVE
ncbi:hypothetical protein CMUS01_05438 [Colletotrichum musicola]|uniref:Uncharacterized protein n=1 Tax=Colletotrichum musicola TaxID=2175873 RepID=A0A8H6KSB7_9PEZI|nr:hypothetical protein CMUS01_05438 [Colletotrichum musicola]